MALTKSRRPIIDSTRSRSPPMNRAGCSMRRPQNPGRQEAAERAVTGGAGADVQDVAPRPGVGAEEQGQAGAGGAEGLKGWWSPRLGVVQPAIATHVDGAGGEAGGGDRPDLMAPGIPGLRK